MKRTCPEGRVQVLIGMQWGDEGKGRVVDVLASEADVVVRYQGGANAGHTVVVGGKKHVFHILPSGMLYPGRLCVIGNGVVIDPEELQHEIRQLDPAPSDIGTRLVISCAAHIVMPYHKKLDALGEIAMRKSSSGAPIGTTGRGIGPCYVDKYNRIGIRAEDLAAPSVLRKKLQLNLDMKNAMLVKLYGEEPFDFDELYARALAWGEFIAPYLGDAALELDRAYTADRKMLFEGAQATLLDIDHGTYPFVTSSSCTAGGACIGGPIGPGRIDRVIGVAKAYCTRVGEGPFPTEDSGAAGALLRDRGAEFGATTGRPRRCGWLDLVALKYAVMVNGIDCVTLTKLDVLSGIERLKVCTAYEISGEHTSHMPASSMTLSEAKPIYTELPGWEGDVTSCRARGDLPKAAREYVEFIERYISVPITMIGVGPGREDTIFC